MDDYGKGCSIYEKNIRLLQLNREWEDKYIYMRELRLKGVLPSDIKN